MWMGLEGIMLSEISHTEKDKYCMISLIGGIYKRQTQMEIEIRMWLPETRGGQKGAVGQSINF